MQLLHCELKSILLCCYSNFAVSDFPESRHNDYLQVQGLLFFSVGRGRVGMNFMGLCVDGNASCGDR